MNERDNLTSEEMRAYRSALNEAYPQPENDIHSGVMKKIRAERLAESRRARRAVIVKWCGIAACLVLVCLVGWRVMPGGDALAPMAENATDDAMAESYNMQPRENFYGAVADSDGFVNGASVVSESNGAPDAPSSYYSADLEVKSDPEETEETEQTETEPTLEDEVQENGEDE